MTTASAPNNNYHWRKTALGTLALVMLSATIYSLYFRCKRPADNPSINRTNAVVYLEQWLRIADAELMVNGISIEDATLIENTKAATNTALKIVTVNVTFKQIDGKPPIVQGGILWIDELSFRLNNAVVSNSWRPISNASHPLKATTLDFLYEIPFDSKGVLYWQASGATKEECVYLGNI